MLLLVVKVIYLPQRKMTKLTQGCPDTSGEFVEWRVMKFTPSILTISIIVASRISAKLPGEHRINRMLGMCPTGNGRKFSGCGLADYRFTAPVIYQLVSPAVSPTCTQHNHDVPVPQLCDSFKYDGARGENY